MKNTKASKIENIVGYIFLSPWLFGLIFFGLGPLLFSIFLAFAEWDLIVPPKFIGLGNFINLFQDDMFWKSFRNTLIFSFSVPIGTFLSLLLAYLMNRPKGIFSFLRSIYFLPSITPAVANTVVWVWLLHPTVGVVNFLLKKLFLINGPNWLGDPNWIIPSLIIISVWGGLGYDIVLFTAGLQAIDPQIYEAAEIDGANKWDVFFKITLPLISPTTFFVIVTSFIWSFQVFDISYIATNGRPDEHSLTIVYYLFQNAFQYFKIGKASAISWVLTAVILLVTYIEFKLEKKYVFYGEGE
jgi:multiple sugar transport system permease protein